MTWYNESRRHSLASKGIRTSLEKKPIILERYSSRDVGDSNVPVDEVRMEIEPILPFLNARVNDEKQEATVSLDYPYEKFRLYHPDITKKELTKLFDELDNKKRETYFALKELEQKGQRPQTRIQSITI